jgi:hypothetical protein
MEHKASKFLFKDKIKLANYPQEVEATVTVHYDKEGAEFYELEVAGHCEYLLYQESASGKFGCEKCGSFSDECQMLGEWVQKHLTL